ncbi:MAG: chemotaxis response regulator protein-glutamate methylesterase [Nitrospirae bacterium]|nr:chemotaxis response regulator protein-glutamate methylesterase [Nitrospirota bacterium]
MTETTPKTRVLVIDDSAYNRRALRRMLEEEAAIEVVDTARDGEEGLKKALDLAPDVITLDLEMPKMDGFTFLRILMSRRPTPVIVVSGRAEDQNTFLAMELGAVDFVAKPQNQISPELYAIRSDLVDKIMAARSVSIDRLARLPQRPAPAPPPQAVSPAERKAGRLVVVGCSTGGPTALPILLAGFPPDFGVPVVVAQHMPPGFTRSFAERMNKTCPLTVREAEHAEEPKPGHVLIAPGGFHMRLKGSREDARIHLERGVRGDRYVPSVDALCASAAELFGPETVGVILTGMGDDGREGVKIIKQHGGCTMAESQETAVIYGMPREAMRTGAVDVQAPVYRLAEQIVARCQSAQTRPAARPAGDGAAVRG